MLLHSLAGSLDSHKSLLIDLQDTEKHCPCCAWDRLQNVGSFCLFGVARSCFKTKWLRKLLAGRYFQGWMVGSFLQTLSQCSLVFFQLIEELKEGEIALAHKCYRILLVFKDTCINTHLFSNKDILTLKQPKHHWHIGGLRRQISQFAEYFHSLSLMSCNLLLPLFLVCFFFFMTGGLDPFGFQLPSL